MSGGKQSKTLMACLKSTKEKQANLFNSDNEEDEREQCSLCDVLEFTVQAFVMWTTALMSANCFCLSFSCSSFQHEGVIIQTSLSGRAIKTREYFCLHLVADLLCHCV